ADYARDPHALLARGLAEGFVYQGEVSPYLGGPRGESSVHLPPSAFVNFLQNHDQVGNRARGERLTTLVRDEAALAAAAAVRLLEIRRAEIAPRILELHAGRFTRANAGRAFAVSWEGAGERLRLIANLGAEAAAAPESAPGRVIFATHPQLPASLSREQLAPWSVTWLLEPAP